jgi:hypothetical protein
MCIRKVPVHAPRYRAEWLAKISEAGVRRRAEHYYQQLDALRPLRARKRGGSLGRKPEAQNMETVAPDSSNRSDPGGHFDRGDADPAPLPHQAPPVDLQRSGARNL